MFKFYSIFLFISLFVSQCFPGLPERLTCADLSVEQRAESDLCCNLGESRICDNGASGCFTQSCSEDLSWSVDDCEDPIPEAAILSDNQEGVCLFSQKLCLEGQLIEPNYSDINLFEEVEMTCDREDNDCDGLIDEGCEMDCGPELCGDVIDNDCDGLVDEGCVEECGDEICDNLDNDCDQTIDEGCDCSSGSVKERACGFGDQGECDAGIQYCEKGVWGSCYGRNDPTLEICDNLDNNCNGEVDDQGACDSWLDEYVFEGKLNSFDVYLDSPKFIAQDYTDKYYISAGNAVYRYIFRTGTLERIAGSNNPGFSGDGGLAKYALLNEPHGIFAKENGDVWIADKNNHRIRKIDGQTGIITTVVGTGEARFNGDGRPARDASLNHPVQIYVTDQNDLWITDQENHRIRRVNGLTGEITTVAGVGIGGFNGDDIRATAAQLNFPNGIFVNENNDLWIADSSNHRIRIVDFETKLITTVAGTGEAGFNEDGIQANLSQLNYPVGIFVNENSDLWIADSSNHRIRVVDNESRIIRTAIGTGNEGYARSGLGVDLAEINFPSSVILDEFQSIWFTDQENNLVRTFTERGAISTVAGNREENFSGDGGLATSARLKKPFAITVNREGDFWIADFGNNRVRRVDSQNGLIQSINIMQNGRSFPLTELAEPADVLFNEINGDLLITDNNNHRILKINNLGELTTIAGTGENGFNGDGILATEAQLNEPYGIFPSAESDDLWIADGDNDRIRKIDGETGLISTVAGNGLRDDGEDNVLATETSLNFPTDVFVDRQEGLWIVDGQSHRIRKVSSARDGFNFISTVAGSGQEGYAGDNGPATEARLNSPRRIFVNAEGDFWIADKDNSRIRKVDAQTRIITTVAGNGEANFSGDGGLATLAGLNNPGDIVLDKQDNLWIADQENDLIRKVDAETGIITTVAGKIYPDGIGEFESAWVEQAYTLLLSPLRDGFFISSLSEGMIFHSDSRNQIKVIIGYKNGFVDGSYVDQPRSQLWLDSEVPAKYSRLLNGASGLAYDPIGQALYISESFNHCIRKVKLHDLADISSWAISTYAGSEGISGFENGNIEDTRFNKPSALAIDVENQRLYVSDQENRSIRVVDLGTERVRVLELSPEAGETAEIQKPDQLIFDPRGYLWLADLESHRVFRLTLEDGRRATYLSVFGNGNTFFEDNISQISSQSASPYPRGLVLKENGDLFVSSLNRIFQIYAEDNLVGRQSFLREIYRTEENSLLMGDLYWSEAESALYVLEITRGHLLRLAQQQP